MTNKYPEQYAPKVIIANHVTEKTSRVLAKNQYVFKVHPLSDKGAVKQAVENEFSVKVAAVNILSMKGKSRRTARGVSKRKDWKKAYVSLREGFSINFDAKVKKE